MTVEQIIRLIEERMADNNFNGTGSDYDWGKFVALRDLREQIIKEIK